MTPPNRVRDLEEYSERLRLGDLTVPPLKPWLLQEGEKMWRRALEAAGNKPGRGELNDHLQLYASACCLQRAREVFDSFEVVDWLWWHRRAITWRRTRFPIMR